MARHSQALGLPAAAIVRFRAALLFVAALIFVYVSLFVSRIPVPIQDVLFFVVLFLEIAMIGAGWWYGIKNQKDIGVAGWRKRVALLEAIANTNAFAIPAGYLIYTSYPQRHMVTWENATLACLVFSLCGVIAGVLSPPRSRFATTLGSLIVALLILAIPVGIL